jgi:hypothetical protein
MHRKLLIYMVRGVTDDVCLHQSGYFPAGNAPYWCFENPLFFPHARSRCTRLHLLK